MIALDIAGRRRAAPHPGPAIARDYLDPLGLDAEALAAQIDMDPTRLAPMLAGDHSIDVETAIRFGRSLQLNPKLIMERQLAHDFAVGRSNEALETLPVLCNDGRVRFPSAPFRSGCLTGLREGWGYGDVRPETLGFYADARDGVDDPRARMLPIERGLWLRVFDGDGAQLWVGIVLETLDGEPLLPFVRPSVWGEWFVNRYRADCIPSAGA